MKKPRSFARRLPALIFLAAGVGVAVMASREDGREKLSQLGEIIGKGVEAAGSALSSARHFASDYVEQLQRRGEASYPSYPHHYQPAQPHQNEYSSVK